MIFCVKVEVGLKQLSINGVRIMPTVFPKDLRHCSGNASVFRGDLVFRIDLVRRRLKELLGPGTLTYVCSEGVIGGEAVPAKLLTPGSVFHTLIDKPLYVAYYDPDFVGSEEVDDFNPVPDSVKKGYREVYYIPLGGEEIPVTEFDKFPQPGAHCKD